MKPCPNCARDDRLEARLAHVDGGPYFVQCWACGMTGPIAPVLSAAEDKWDELPRHGNAPAVVVLCTNSVGDDVDHIIGSIDVCVPGGVQPRVMTKRRKLVCGGHVDVVPGWLVDTRIAGERTVYTDHDTALAVTEAAGIPGAGCAPYQEPLQVAVHLNTP